MTEENTSSVFSSASTDIIDDYCSDYNEKTVEYINEIGESITKPAGANIIEAINSVAKGGPYYIVEDGITKECYDVVIYIYVSQISAYTATKDGNVLPKETTPQAAFTATGDNSGTLSGVDTAIKYSTDGGASWTDITGATAEITGVTADKDIQVVKKGDGVTTADSDAQIIDVTQAATPVGIGKRNCTTAAQNDGMITNVDSTMEYRLSAASKWTSISGNTVTGLVNGTYYVRVKAKGTVLASAAAKLIIGEHTCASQGYWLHDANEHWQLCACGAKVYRAAHTGGTATCTKKAVCNICGVEYGEINASNHTNLVKTQAKAATHMAEGNIEYWYCNGCDKYFSDEAGTQKIDLADTVIPKLTEHTADGSGWHSDETSHWNTCECGEKLNKVAHTFEWVIDKEATETAAGSKHEECTVCGYAKAAVEIPATGNVILWIAAILAAGTALTGAVLYRRKRKNSR